MKSTFQQRLARATAKETRELEKRAKRVANAAAIESGKVVAEETSKLAKNVATVAASESDKLAAEQTGRHATKTRRPSRKPAPPRTR
jgi:hypothetical protein